ncbi:MAG: hypothetical protein SF052_02460 [Bacteroidia bacterium]|nr:hypothetical protein [Bacteroidia bacterium]
MPESRAELSLKKSFTPEEFNRLKNGLIPREMEDKWFIFFEDNYLYFHRSWTGFEIFRIELAPQSDGSATIRQGWVNRDKTQYSGEDPAEELRTVTFLLDKLI